ncbi:hypothetical protein QEB74_004059 [Escherichia coli]|nr:hypothetical protein [Escherichia coli]EKT3736797.1 hypothetical protein [Escherichia coli]
MIKQAWAYMDAATVARNAAGIKHEERAAILDNANGASVRKLAAQLPEELADKLEDLAKSMMPHTQLERTYTGNAEIQRLLQSLRVCVWYRSLSVPVAASSTRRRYTAKASWQLRGYLLRCTAYLLHRLRKNAHSQSVIGAGR